MSESEAIGALLTLAEIGIGLVALGGLVLAVTRRHSEMSRGETLQLRELVRAGLGGVALALVPVGALLAGASGPVLWRLASATHVMIILGGAFITVTYQIRRTPPDQRDPVLPIVTFGLGSFGILLQGFNVIGWPTPASPGLYFLGVLIPLAVSAIYFARLLFSRLL